MRRPLLAACIATTSLWLAGCDQLGLESATAVAARREAEGKAVGAGCRHAARSVEVCYELNKRADKAAVFAGWRDMNDYMRENKIDAMPAPPPVVNASEGEPDAEEDKPAEAAGKGAKATKTAATKH